MTGQRHEEALLDLYGPLPWILGPEVNYCRTEFLGFIGAFTGVGLFVASRTFVKGPALVITRIFVPPTPTRTQRQAPKG